MPLYEYQCYVCKHRFERLQKVAAGVIKDCPSCGGAVRRLLGAPALQFKGSGWYVTDYGKGNSSNKDNNGNNGKNGTKPRASEEKATDTPAAKSDSTTKDASSAKKSTSSDAASSSASKPS